MLDMKVILVGLLCLVNQASIILALKSWELPDRGSLFSAANPSLNDDWENYKITYGKYFTNKTEEAKRRLYWEDNKSFIEEHNSKYHRRQVSYSLGMNRFADTAEDEFEQNYLQWSGSPDAMESNHPQHLPKQAPRLPDRVDWRRKGYVTAVRNQDSGGRSCNSCWAFAATGALEAQMKKITGKLVKLSEQNLVDCANETFGNFGCKGPGKATNAFNYVHVNGGLDSEECYPYTASVEACSFRQDCVAAKDKGYMYVTRSTESLMSAVANIGPIAVQMDCSHRSFWFYKRGIYFEPKCESRMSNHAMLLIGYGTSRGRHYWTLKNSWGRDWGHRGYVFVARTEEDNCGLTMSASYPIL